MSRLITTLISGSVLSLLAFITLHDNYWLQVTDSVIVGKNVYDILGKRRVVVQDPIASTRITKEENGELVTKTQFHLPRPPGAIFGSRAPTDEEATIWRHYFGKH